MEEKFFLNEEVIYSSIYHNFYTFFNFKPKYIIDNNIKEYNAINPDKCIIYFNKKGFLSNYNFPAVIDENFIMYCKNGYVHRTDGPAIIRMNLLTFEYYNMGKLYRENGPTKIIYNNNTLEFNFDENLIKNKNKHTPIKMLYKKNLNGNIFYEIQYYDPNLDNLIKIKPNSWIIKKRLNNNEYPGYLYYNMDKIVMEYYDEPINNLYFLHRNKFPAKINVINNDNYSNIELEYYNKGINTNKDKPSRVFEKEGNFLINYMYKGYYHNNNGPAIIKKDNLEWYFYDKENRIVKRKRQIKAPIELFFIRNKYGVTRVKLNNGDIESLPKSIDVYNSDYQKILEIKTNKELEYNKKLKIVYEYNKDDIKLTPYSE